MQILPSRIRDSVWERYGSCSHCMGVSLLVAVSFNLVLLSSFLAFGLSNVTVMVGVAALLGLANCLAHIVVFGIKWARWTNDEEGIVLSRRRAALVRLGRGMVAGLAVASTPAFAQLGSLPSGHVLQSCCEKKCGGNCCRCGKASGFKSDCSSSCAVGVTELRGMAASTRPIAFTAVGTLLHVGTRRPLRGQVVKVIVPGGQEFTTTTAANGQFRLVVGEPPVRQRDIQLGRLSSVTRAELDPAEDDAFSIFVIPR